MSLRYLVTGGAGFIGSCFVGQRIAEGNRVWVLDALTYAGHRANLDWIAASEGMLQFVEGDICDAPLVNALFEAVRFDVVVHFAAESHVDNSITGSKVFINTNILGTHALLEAARAHYLRLESGMRERFRFIQVSTDEVYGSLGESGAFDESAPMRPNSPYSASKAAGDLLARAWSATYGLPTIVTHCTNNYGPRQFPEKLIPLMIRKALAGEVMPIYGSGHNVRDWIHVEDHCRGVHLAATQGRPGHTYCFGGHAEKSNSQVVAVICRLLDDIRPRADGVSYREQIRHVADRLGHDFRYALDDRKARAELGYRPEHDFEGSMARTVEWYVENAAWMDAVTADGSRTSACVPRFKTTSETP